MGETNEKERDPVSYYIKQIRRSNAHDDVSTELYWALECEGDPPYSKWVATWILKCIRECFEDKIEADILLASFALLPGYYLAGCTVKNRLWQYIYDSDYLTIYPSESGRRIEDIHDKKEILNIRQKIEKKERKCVEELIAYIKNIINPTNHIKELKGYGRQETLLNNKKIAFKPDPEHLKLSYPKQEDNNPQPTRDTDPHSKSGQDEETSFPEGSFGEEATARIALQQDDQTIETQQLDNIENRDTINDKLTDNPKNGDDSIEDCVTKIRFSEHHDDVAEKLYEALCGQGEPPYDQWVATWILKCIREKFKRTVHDDIMLASFALLPGYKLEGKDGLEYRLAKYLDDSEYLEIYPPETYHKNITGTQESLQVMESLKELEQTLVHRLIQYVECLPDPDEHINNLSKFGTRDDGGRSYRIKEQHLRYCKKRKVRLIRGCKLTIISICVSVLLAFYMYSKILDYQKLKPVNEPLICLQGDDDWFIMP